MNRRFTYSWVILFSYLFMSNGLAQTSDSFSRSFGFSAGVTYAGPLSQMSKYLERSGFNATSNGFLFGPRNYPVKTGPRGDFSATYSWKLKNGKTLEIEANIVQLGEVAGLNNRGNSIELGFGAFTLGTNYHFGSRLAKMSIGPTVMFNRAYFVNFDNLNESKESISNSVTMGLKTKLMVFLWNRKRTYGNVSAMYVLSYATEQGPFPTDNNNELESTPLNFGYGSVFLAFGVKF